MKENNLTEKVQRYQQTGLNKTELIQEIAVYTYSSVLLKKYLTEDQKGDFLCFFYSEMENLIERFHFIGKPFEAYLHTILKWRIKTFLVRDSKKRDVLHILKDRHFLEPLHTIDRGIHADDEIEISSAALQVFHGVNTDPIPANSDKNRLLFLFLKEYTVSNPDYLPYISKITGYSEEWIIERAEILRTYVRKRMKRFKILTEKRNRTFFQLYLMEKKLHEAYTDSEKKLYSDKIKILTRRLQMVNKEISKISLHPTHREISSVMRIPKGTIDSGLYYLKKSFLKIDMEEEKSA